MKLLYIFTLLSSICLGVKAQSLDEFKANLQTPDQQSGKRAVVREHGTAATAIRTMSSAARPQKVQGYRVCIFMDNSQNAREGSASALVRFRELYPGVAASRIYTEPYYKVTVGSCITSEEGIILWGNVKSSFEKAFIVREEIPLLVLSEYNKPIKIDEATPTQE